MAIEKQAAGFKYGKHGLAVREIIGTVKHNGRSYGLYYVETEAGQFYYSFRLYNSNGHFIKQFLFEREVIPGLMNLLYQALEKKKVTKRRL